MKNRIQRLLKTLSQIEPHELAPCSLSFLLVLSLMSSYYILRPVRDGMASDWTDAELSFLWTLNFFISTALVGLYGFAVKWIRFRRLVPTLYAFFAISFFLCYVGISASPAHSVLFDKGFYLWVSVFSLFNVSAFWSCMSELYSSEEATRLFPIIGAGASVGALLGPAVPALLAQFVGTDTLLLISATLLTITIPVVLAVTRIKKKSETNSINDSGTDQEKIGGHPFAGFSELATNTYLRNIALFMVLYTCVASVVYFQQKNLLADYSLATRSQILAAVDWIVNISTFTIAFFATSRVVRWFGMAITLSIVPAAMCAGLLWLAFTPTLFVALFLQVARRTGNYAITRPAREMLFTRVSREARFKTKPVIDISAYRGGDMVSSWFIATMTEGMGYGMGLLAGVGSLMALFWAILACFLGNRFDQVKSSDSE